VLLLSMACSSTGLKGNDGGAGTGGGSAGTGSNADGGAGTGGGNVDAGPESGVKIVVEVPAEPARDLDLLFLIDNSASMAKLQSKLTGSFPTFINVLRTLPGGLPNLHIAVVSSDLGAGAYDAGDIPGCRHHGDQGIMQNAPRGTTCATGSLNGGQHFIVDSNGQKNYAGTLEDTFACIASLGDQGCGFEHQLGSLLRALGADGNGGPPPENYGFNRPNAVLAITILTNEDDCSAPAESTLFDPSSRYVADPLGPVSSFRCNEYGHLCGGQRPPRNANAELSGMCTSAEDGKLLRVADVAKALKALKPGMPNGVLLSVIAGPPSPYNVKLTTPVLADDPSFWPSIEHSCTAVDDSYADPGVRMKELTDAFGENGVFQTICGTSLEPASQRIAEEIGKRMEPACLIGIPDAQPGTPGFQPDCRVVDHFGSAFSGQTDVPLQTCLETKDVAPCWYTDAPTSACASGAVRFRRPADPGDLRSTTFTCKP
jgi:hypothetical protein